MHAFFGISIGAFIEDREEKGKEKKRKDGLAILQQHAVSRNGKKETITLCFVVAFSSMNFLSLF